MKRYFFVPLFVILLSPLSKAQINDDLSVIPILYQGESKYKELVDELNKTIERFEIDVVQESSGRNTQMRLIAGKNYSIVLLVENERISEFVLRIYSADNKTRALKEETNIPARLIELTFQPERTEFYNFEIVARKFMGANKYARYCLIISS